MTVSKFQLDYHPLELASWKGRIARVPWDSEAFALELYELSDLRLNDGVMDFNLAVSELRSIPDTCGADAITVRLEPELSLESLLLQQAGFLGIETSVGLSCSNLQKWEPRFPLRPLREATLADEIRLRTIAQRAFVTERFHRDYRFDYERAQLRYENWIQQSLRTTDDLVIVPDEGSEFGGFMVVRTTGSEAHFLLAAVAPERKGRGLGMLLWHSSVHEMKVRGSRIGSTRVSANNVAVFRIWQAIGFSIDSVNLIFHWVRDREVSSISPRA